eukprot:SAG31_NODE_41810_length_274_cov_0.880000_1_plen_50_part_01
MLKKCAVADEKFDHEIVSCMVQGRALAFSCGSIELRTASWGCQKKLHAIN